LVSFHLEKSPWKIKVLKKIAWESSVDLIYLIDSEMCEKLQIIAKLFIAHVRKIILHSAKIIKEFITILQVSFNKIRLWNNSPILLSLPYLSPCFKNHNSITVIKNLLNERTNLISFQNSLKNQENF